MRILPVLMVLATGHVLAQDPHAGHDMSTMPPEPAPAQVFPDVAQAQRAAAFPDLTGMNMREHMNDDPLNAMVLIDRFEARDAGTVTPLAWDATVWIGRDFNKLLLRSEGERVAGSTQSGDVEALWARTVARWWDVVAGARHDFGAGQARDWLAFGFVGMAPYRFHVEATAYVGEGGRTALQLQSEYDLLLTNRLILQPRAQWNVYGRYERPQIEMGLRLRYEIRREIAPYAGIAWTNESGAGSGRRELQGLAGLRLWY